QLVEPIHALVVDLATCSTQQSADAPVAKAPPPVREPYDALTRGLVVLCALGRVPPAVAPQAHQSAGAPFTARGLFQYLAARASPRRWAQRFTPKATFSASLSNTASASSFLSRLFSASRSRSRLASLASMPPNLARHLQNVAELKPSRRHRSATLTPASVCLMNPMTCSSVNLLLLTALLLGCAASSLLPWRGWRIAGQQDSGNVDPHPAAFHARAALLPS